MEDVVGDGDAALPPEQFVEVVLELLMPDARPEHAAMSDHLCDDLGLDSLELYYLLVLVETLANVEVPPMTLPNLETLGDAYLYYSSLMP